MVDRTLMQYFLCLTSRMVKHSICVVIPYLCCDIIMVWYIVELHGLTPLLSEVPHCHLWNATWRYEWLFVLCSSALWWCCGPSLPYSSKHLFYKNSSAKTGPYITRNGVSSCRQNLYTFCCGTGARWNCPIFCFNNSEMALSIHNTYKNAVATSVNVL